MEYEQVREKTARELARQNDELIWEHLKLESQAVYFLLADRILSLVEIKSDDQSLPECSQKKERIELQNYEQRLIDPDPFEDGYASSQYDMLKPDSEGRVWVRVIPKPKRK